MEYKNYAQHKAEIKKEHPDWDEEKVSAEIKLRLNMQKAAKISESKVDVDTVSKNQNKNPKDVIMVSKSDLKELVSKAAAQIAEDIIKKKEAESISVKSIESNQLLSELVDTMRAERFPGSIRNQVTPIDQSELDMGDYMSEPKVFYSYRGYYAIYGDKMYGKDIKTPYGTPIVFKYFSSKKIKGDSRFAQTTLHVCVARIHSKKEYEWLKKSSLFNIEFFESSQSMEEVDLTFATKISEINAMISGMSQHQVLSRAEAEGIELSLDIEETKRNLISKLAQKEMATMSAANKKRAESYAKGRNEVDTNPDAYLKNVPQNVTTE